MLAAGVICVSLRVVGNGCCGWSAWAALPLAALLMAERSGAADAEPGASAGNPVDPAPAGEPVAQVALRDAAADAPWWLCNACWA